MRGFGKTCLVLTLLAVSQVSFGGTLVQIDSVADGSTSVVGDASPTLVYGTPITASGWANVATGSQTWDFTNPVYDVVVQGTVTGVNSGGAWMSLGLLDKHYLDGLAIGQDPAISYASGQYGFGMNGGMVIVGGPDYLDDNDLRVKTEDGWPKDAGTENIGTGSFDFKIRYGFTAGSDKDTRTLEGWWKAAGAAEDQWVSFGVTTLGYAINGEYDYTGDTTTPERYHEDQWDQTMLGMMIVNDGSTNSGSITLANMTMSLDVLEGDANRDGVVSAGDYASVQANFGNTGTGLLLGDANCDGVVSAGDYASVQANFGNTTATGVSPAPEPATMSLLVLGGAALLRRRRK